MRSALLRLTLVVFLAIGLAGAVGACNRSSSAADGDVITATFWFSYGGRNREVLEELIEQFHAQHPEYQIDATFQGSYFDALAKLRSALITGEAPTFSHIIAEVLPYLWDAGALEDLTPFITGERGGDRPLDEDRLVRALSQQGTFATGGRRVPTFALPFNRSTPIVFYNRDIFRHEGLEPPTSWEELADTAERLTQRENGRTVRYGLELPVDWWFWAAMLHQAGGSIFSADGQQPTFHQRPGQEALAFWVDLVERGVMRPPGGRDYNAWEITNNDFISERAAMIWTSTAFLSYLTDNAPFDVGAAPLPGHLRHAVPTGGTFFVMPAGGDPVAQEAAWAFIHFMMQPENTAYWSRRTGYMPVHQDALALPEMQQLYAENPNYLVAMNQLDVAFQFPFSPSLFIVQRQHVQPCLEGPVRGLSTVEDALDTAAEGARRTLHQYRTACFQEAE